MELRQLRYFVTVAEHRHFGRAADALHVVQPAVSQQIARLERELGLTLFDRSHRQVRLTADGAAFLPQARQVLTAADRAAQAAAELAAGQSGLLRVGSSEGLGPALERVLDGFRQHRPAADVELVPGPTPAKLAAVATGELDAAFVRAAVATPGVVVHRLWDEPLRAAVPSGLVPGLAPGLVPGGSPVELASLARLPLARADRDVNPGMYDLIGAACQAAGFTPLPGPPVGSVQDLLAAQVAAGRCWTMLYASTPAAAIPHGVALVPCEPRVCAPTGLAVPDPGRRALTSEFLACARRTIS